MFSFDSLRVSTCTYLVILLIGMSSALSYSKQLTVCALENERTSVQTNVNDMEVDDPLVRKYAVRGLEKYATEKSYEPFISKIHSATSQTVAVKLYKMNITFGETSCSKGRITPCELKKDGEFKNCSVEVKTYPCNSDISTKVSVTCP